MAVFECTLCNDIDIVDAVPGTKIHTLVKISYKYAIYYSI